MFSRATLWLPIGLLFNLLHPASPEAHKPTCRLHRPPNRTELQGLRVQTRLGRIGANWIEGSNMKAEEVLREKRK